MGSRGENVTCTRTSFRAVCGEEHGKVGLIGVRMRLGRERKGKIKRDCGVVMIRRLNWVYSPPLAVPFSLPLNLQSLTFTSFPQQHPLLNLKSSMDRASSIYALATGYSPCGCAGISVFPSAGAGPAAARAGVQCPPALRWRCSHTLVITSVTIKKILPCTLASHPSQPSPLITTIIVRKSKLTTQDPPNH